MASNKELLDKECSFKAMVDESPTNMFKVVKWWSRNQQNCYLIATKTPHSNIDHHIKPYEEHIKIANPKNPKQRIIFQYSKEQRIRITPTSSECGKNHWAAGAILDGHTTITDVETADFLKTIRTATFGIFEIHEVMPSVSRFSKKNQQAYTS